MTEASAKHHANPANPGSGVRVPLGREVCETALVAHHSVIIIAERVG
jgi:hypothetical protein